MSFLAPRARGSQRRDSGFLSPAHTICYFVMFYLGGALGVPRRFAAYDSIPITSLATISERMAFIASAFSTGGRAWLPNIEVCGKTGTAQVASAEYVKAKGGGHDLKDNASIFVGFAPRAAPEILVVALFEHGAEGPLAAPIVRDVMTAYFDKKVRIDVLRQRRNFVPRNRSRGLASSQTTV